MSYDALMAAQYMGQQLNVDMESKRADTAFRKQQTANAQMQSMMQQKEQAAKDEVSNYLRSEQVNQSLRDALPGERAAAFQKLTDYAIGRGNLEAAASMENLAKSATDTAKKADEEVALRKNAYSQALAEKASELSHLPEGTQPSMEQLAGFASAFNAAGNDATKLPLPNTPEFKSVLDSAVTAGMTSKERLFRDDKLRAEKEAFAAKEEETQRRIDDRAEARVEAARFKTESLDIKKQQLDINKQLATSLIDARKTEAETAVAGGAKRQAYVTSTTGYGAELLRNLNNVTAFGASDTTGPFAHLDNKGTVLSSLSSNAANAFTPGKNQQLEAALQGVALEAAQLATNIGGRGVTESLKKEFGKMIEPRKGDTNGTIMYRLANIAEFARTRMELLGADEGSPTEQVARARTIAYLNQIPTPRELTKLFNEKKIPNADTHKYGAGTLEDKMKSVRAIVEKGDAEASIPQSQRDLLNKYPPK